MRQKSEESMDLSTCETLIMKIVWDAKEDISVQDLITGLRERFQKDYARTTVVTFLGKIAAKGYISTYRNGKNSYVHAKKEERWYSQKKLEEDAAFWFDSSPSKLMSALCDDRKISKEEIAKMRRLLDELDD